MVFIAINSCHILCLKDKKTKELKERHLLLAEIKNLLSVGNL